MDPRSSVSAGFSKASVLRLENVHLLYGRTLALDIPHLEVAPGERVFVLGHSGSGKSSLSRLIKGRLRPSTGRVEVLGEDPAAGPGRRRREIQRRVAMIDQEFFLVPRMSVVANVLTGALGRVPRLPSLFGWYPAEAWRQAESILREVGLQELAERRVETLSGGQRQRAAIARALMQEADVVVADEPISSLDPELAEDVLELLVQCTARRGVTLMVTLHQPELARRFASRFLGLADGRVVYDGPPEGFRQEHAEEIYRSVDRGDDSESGGDRDDGDGAAAAMATALPGPGLRLVGD
ncbi:MAG: ATP-binding cassette domain-containing protein [Acidobacteriota bacterium]|nr:ATP-binding cassette domain-containing protein [Acidobacteriota bacterium]